MTRNQFRRAYPRANRRKYKLSQAHVFWYRGDINTGYKEVPTVRVYTGRSRRVMYKVGFDDLPF